MDLREKAQKLAQALEKGKEMSKEEIEEQLSEHIKKSASLVAQAIFNKRLDIATEVVSHLLADIISSEMFLHLSSDQSPQEFVEEKINHLVQLIDIRIALFLEIFKKREANAILH